jgi:hypothetical protein
MAARRPAIHQLAWDFGLGIWLAVRDDFRNWLMANAA